LSARPAGGRKNLLAIAGSLQTLQASRYDLLARNSSWNLLGKKESTQAGRKKARRHRQSAGKKEKPGTGNQERKKDWKSKKNSCKI